MNEINDRKVLAFFKGVLFGLIVAGLMLLILTNAHAETLSQRHNNPVNLKAFFKWDGMIGKDDQGHAIFNDMDHGTRAALKNALNAQRSRPHQTLLDWMETFAEKNGEHEAQYIAQKMGISIYTQLALIDMTELIRHQAWFEGRIVLSKNYIQKIKTRFSL